MATGPMPKKLPRRGKIPCGVCQGPIVDGKDEALLCEGDCGLWYHRGCTSVPPALYKSLSASDEPFVCLTCNNSHLKQEIAQLRKDLATVVDLRDKYLALEAEVATLRKAMDSVVKEAKSSPNVPPNAKHNSHSKRSYAAAIGAAKNTRCSKAETTSVQS